MFKKTRYNRHKFIINSNKDDLVKYFKELRREANNNSHFLEIFNEDKQFYLNIKSIKNFDKQYGGVIGTGATAVAANENETANLVRHNPPLNMCLRIKSRIGCDEQRMMLTNVEKLLSKHSLQHNIPNEVLMVKIREFIDYLACCADIYPPKVLDNGEMKTTFEYEKFIKDILSLIFQDKQLTLQSHIRLREVMNSEKGVQTNVFLLKLDSFFDSVRRNQSMPITLKDVQDKLSGGSSVQTGGSFWDWITNKNPTKHNSPSTANVDFNKTIKPELDAFHNYIQKCKIDNINKIKGNDPELYKTINETIDIIKSKPTTFEYSNILAICSKKMGYNNEFIDKLCKKN